MTFGILVEISAQRPVLQLVGPNEHLSMDGWQIDYVHGSYSVREARPVGVKLNGKAVRQYELVDGDYLEVGKSRYRWKEFSTSI